MHLNYRHKISPFISDEWRKGQLVHQPFGNDTRLDQLRIESFGVEARASGYAHRPAKKPSKFIY